MKKILVGMALICVIPIFIGTGLWLFAATYNMNFSFTEDFSTTANRDATPTTADWNTTTGRLKLPVTWDGTWTATSLTNVPPLRDKHTAVWTGNRMIVWGGTNVLTYLNTGGIYDPSNNSWTATSTTSVPGVRRYHTAVWTGSKPSARQYHTMAYDSARGKTVLFGGYTGAVWLQDTYEWDGVNWTPITPTTKPSARAYTAMAYDSARGKTVLFGGNDGAYLQDTYEWDGTNWTLRAPTTKPPARYSHAMAYDSARGKTVLFGGYTGVGNLQDTYEWDGANWTLLNPATKPSARYRHTMAYDSARGKTVLFGGDTGVVNLQDTYEWDGANWTPLNPATKPSARRWHAMAYDSARGKTVLFGGEAPANNQETYEWNGADWTLLNPTTKPSARNAHAMAYDSARGKTVLFGGNTGAVNQQTYEWNGANWTFLNLTTQMIVWGGMSGSSTYVTTGGVYDPTGPGGVFWTATSLSNQPTARGYHTAVWNPISNTMIVWGGYNGSSALNTGGVYDPATDSWLAGGTSTGTNCPSVRYFHTAVWNPISNTMIVWGGHNGSSALNTGGVYDPSTNSWTATSLTNAPAATYAHTAVWTGSGSEPWRNKMIVWGGGLLNTGGVYDPSTNSWLAGGTSTTNAPAGRYYHTAVWTGSRMIVWAGQTASGSYNVTNTGGVYDPSNNTWTAAGTSTGTNCPSARAFHTAVWNPISNTMIVWDGSVGSGPIDTGGVYNPSGYSSPRIGQSIKLNTSPLIKNIVAATLTVTPTLPTSTAITYELTANNSNWYQVTPGVKFTFPVGGTDLRWRANLSTTDPSSTPEIDSLAIDYEAVTGRIVQTAKWTSIVKNDRPVMIGHEVPVISWTARADAGTAHWKSFRLREAGEQPVRVLDVAVYEESGNNGYWDRGDKLIAKGKFNENREVVLNMRQWPITITEKTYYITEKVSMEGAGGSRIGLFLDNDSWLEFGDATCTGMPP